MRSRCPKNSTKTTGPEISGACNRLKSMEDQQAPPEQHEDGLLGRIEVIEAQPLEQRAAGYDQLAEELLAELQRSDHDGAE